MKHKKMTKKKFFKAMEKIVDEMEAFIKREADGGDDVLLQDIQGWSDAIYINVRSFKEGNK